MRTTKGVLPLYYKVASVLRSKIERGKYAENSLLPSEQDLCNEFGVSRITVRQATALLKREGLIYPRAGYGTIVCPRRRTGEPYARIVGSLDDLIQFGSSTEFVPISKLAIPAPKFVAERLRCSQDEEVFRYAGLRMLSEVGEIAYMEVFVPYRLGLDIPSEMIKERPLFNLLEDIHGLRISDSEQVMSATNADNQIASILKVKRGTPLLKTVRTYFTQEGQPVQVGVSYFNTAKFEPVIHLGHAS
jgi:GntR family transcriptional regulator